MYNASEKKKICCPPKNQKRGYQLVPKRRFHFFAPHSFPRREMAKRDGEFGAKREKENEGAAFGRDAQRAVLVPQVQHL